MAVKQTAGRTALGEFAPKFAELNDDVLFGQVWSREDKLSLKERSLITVAALLSQWLTDTSFVHHLESAKANGITKRNCRSHYARSLLCRLAQSVGGFPLGKRYLERGRKRSGRKDRL